MPQYIGFQQKNSDLGGVVRAANFDQILGLRV